MIPNNHAGNNIWFLTWQSIFLALAALTLESEATQAQEPNESSLATEELDDQQIEMVVCGGVIVILSDEVPPAAAVGGPFSINADFDPNITAAQEAVIQQAINEWQTIIETAGVNPNSYPITFQNGPLAPGGSTDVVTNSSGVWISAVVTFHNDGSIPWWVDPTPADDFDDTIPAGRADYKSVARHEIGHAVGWVPSRRVTPFLNGNIFDQNRLNIATGGLHTNALIHPNDIMTPSIPVSARKRISLYPAAAMIARAYEYDITMKFVDGAHTGSETGSANKPWNTFTEGLTSAPIGSPLLLIRGTYRETLPIVHDTALTISAAREGSAVITGP